MVEQPSTPEERGEQAMQSLGVEPAPNTLLDSVMNVVRHEHRTGRPTSGWPLMARVAAGIVLLALPTSGYFLGYRSAASQFSVPAQG